MCFSASAPAATTPPPAQDWEYVDVNDVVVPEGTKDARRRLKAKPDLTSIMLSGNDASANAPGDDGGSGSASP